MFLQHKAVPPSRSCRKNRTTTSTCQLNETKHGLLWCGGNYANIKIDINDSKPTRTTGVLFARAEDGGDGDGDGDGAVDDNTISSPTCEVQRRDNRQRRGTVHDSHKEEEVGESHRHNNASSWTRSSRFQLGNQRQPREGYSPTWTPRSRILRGGSFGNLHHSSWPKP